MTTAYDVDLGDANVLIEANVDRVRQKGPGLDSDFNVCVLFRDRAAKKSFVAGLGVYGVGMAWLDDARIDLSENLGWDTAPDAEAP